MNKKDLRKPCIDFGAGSLAVFWDLRSGTENPFHSWCTVYGLCRLMQIL